MDDSILIYELRAVHNGYIIKAPNPEHEGEVLEHIFTSLEDVGEFLYIRDEEIDDAAEVELAEEAAEENGSAEVKSATARIIGRMTDACIRWVEFGPVNEEEEGDDSVHEKRVIGEIVNELRLILDEELY